MRGVKTGLKTIHQTTAEKEKNSSTWVLLGKLFCCVDIDIECKNIPILGDIGWVGAYCFIYSSISLTTNRKKNLSKKKHSNFHQKCNENF